MIVFPVLLPGQNFLFPGTGMEITKCHGKGNLGLVFPGSTLTPDSLWCWEVAMSQRKNLNFWCFFSVKGTSPALQYWWAWVADHLKVCEIRFSSAGNDQNLWRTKVQSIETHFLKHATWVVKVVIKDDEKDASSTWCLLHMQPPELPSSSVTRATEEEEIFNLIEFKPSVCFSSLRISNSADLNLLTSGTSRNLQGKV